MLTVGRIALLGLIGAAIASHIYYSLQLRAIQIDIQTWRQKLYVAPHTNHQQFLLRQLPSPRDEYWRFYVYKPEGVRYRLNYALVSGKQDGFPTPERHCPFQAWVHSSYDGTRELRELRVDISIRRHPEETKLIISDFTSLKLSPDHFLHTGNYKAHRLPTDQTDAIPTAVLRLTSTTSDEELVVWLDEEPGQ